MTPRKGVSDLSLEFPARVTKSLLVGQSSQLVRFYYVSNIDADAHSRPSSFLL